MKASRFTTEQIVGILQEAASGTQARVLCRRHGITETTFYRWRRLYGGMQKSEARRLRQLEDENRRLKKIIAEQALDLAALKDVAGRKW
jgi:putative transposase